jgi:hypothetical protein
MFTIKKLELNSLPTELFIFCDTCKEQSITNNISVKAMKIGRWGNDAWWTTWVDDRIVSISGMHPLPEISEDCWRVMFRTATLKEFRALAGPVSKNLTHDLNWGKILPFQLEYAKEQKAKKVVFTTNSSIEGDLNSYRTNRVVEKTLAARGLVKLIHENIILYNTMQNVWEVTSYNNS